MNWKELRIAYFDSLNRLASRGWKRAAEGFDELEEEIKNRFPEANINPIAIIDQDFEGTNPRFYDMVHRKFLVSRKCFEALQRTKRILEPVFRKEYQDSFQYFQQARHISDQLVIFFEQWLRANGWQITSEKYFHLFNSYLHAEKGKDKLIVSAVPPYVSLSTFSRAFLEDEFQKPIRDQMMSLVEEKIANPEITPVLLIANDEDTLNAALPYLPFLKKLEIRIFSLTGPDNVVEL